MIYRGTVRDGVVILPPDAHLADGLEVTVQPVNESGKLPAQDDVSRPSEWPDGYFEQTAGALTGEEFERPPQGELPKRDHW